MDVAVEAFRARDWVERPRQTTLQLARCDSRFRPNQRFVGRRQERQAGTEARTQYAQSGRTLLGPTTRWRPARRHGAGTPELFGRFCADDVVRRGGSSGGMRFVMIRKAESRALIPFHASSRHRPHAGRLGPRSTAARDQYGRPGWLRAGKYWQAHRWFASAACGVDERARKGEGARPPSDVVRARHVVG